MERDAHVVPSLLSHKGGAPDGTCRRLLQVFWNSAAVTFCGSIWGSKKGDSEARPVMGNPRLQSNGIA